MISALFGLFQGGIVPMYAIIVREYFPPRQAGTLVGLVIMSTIFGMALGGWMSGAIFDLTGSYWQAFANGFAWNVLNRPSCCSCCGGTARAACSTLSFGLASSAETDVLLDHGPRFGISRRPEAAHRARRNRPGFSSSATSHSACRTIPAQ